ncbi:MAG: DUF4157 domain-containing protein [Anaerolinea sp.]|nr:DUF4157 domain-containing protein [Anaerolinea sp.]
MMSKQKNLLQKPRQSATAVNQPVRRKQYTRDPVTHLQRTLGNQAIGRLLIQRKMTLGPVGDAYEQEADTVAKQVVTQIGDSPQPATQRQEEEDVQMKPLAQRQEEEELQMKPLPAISTIQRQEEELQMKPLAQRQEEEEVQLKPLAQRQEEEELQAKRDPMRAGGELDGSIESSLQSARAGGQPLPDNVRSPMEHAFGADFSGVKIHTGGQADTLNRSLQARAFTTGQDVFFRDGQYNPDSTQGQELLAHELTHTIQQGAAPQASVNAQRQPISGIQRQDDIEVNNKPALLKIHADIEADAMGIRELKEGAVGHTWVSLHWKDPKAVPENIHEKHKPFLEKGEDPFGFWPRMFRDYDPLTNEWQEADDRVGYSSNPFQSYVPGQMLHPDIMHQPRATQIYDITRHQADQVIDYAESKRNAQYSVFFYNCTTFAKEAAEAAGLTPPQSSTLGICYPNALYDSIKKNHEKGKGTTELTDVSGTRTRVEGIEEPNKKN